MAERAKKRRLHGGRVVLLAVLLAGLYLVSLVVRIRLAGQQDDRGPADVIIVLGAAQYDGIPSPVYRARLDHALTLYHAGHARRLLFTGGARPGDRFTEAYAGAQYAHRFGVPDEHILLESKGRTSWQQLQASAEIARRNHLRTAILVSDPFHAFRLRRMAHDLGLHVHISPAAHSRIRSPRIQARYITREVAAYAVYRLVGM